MKNTNLVADAEGYYEVQLTDLDRPNSYGEWKLPLSDAEIANVNKRAALGALRGEHSTPDVLPKDKSMPIIDDQEIIDRMTSIFEDNVALTIKEIRAETMDDPREPTRRIQRIMGRVKPAGPKGHVLQDLFDNNQPVYFGMRSITDTPNCPGEAVWVHHVITWDLIGHDPYP